MITRLKNINNVRWHLGWHVNLQTTANVCHLLCLAVHAELILTAWMQRRASWG